MGLRRHSEYKSVFGALPNCPKSLRAMPIDIGGKEKLSSLAPCDSARRASHSADGFEQTRLSSPRFAV